MKEAVLVIVKPDGMRKGLAGVVLSKLEQTDLDLVAARLVQADQTLAKEHYSHLRDKPFFQELLQYLTGDIHKEKNLLAIVYYGENAIVRCRQIAGSTNPEEAEAKSIRGALGRITTKSLFENVVHVSSDRKEAEREIKLWFNPDQINKNIFPDKIENVNNYQQRIWA